ncbi:hypothetical protein BDA96_05G226600 [Sorghum bicolor]|uniref:KIB1-4 beta-propeller domain-containing protein n=1 Tax=Sorghum bicolor TaxID=4558 RepID=A0A921QZJ9_SORBI|nr:hypothetical protein BDA96_05G226600 [Sorghum bicolor]KAG0530896.1 hypothetical protein BDA96_05G226600 [Sorghum bicolor]KAG0530897.1 hypothetical protein BDA96_05G226600 [Sorghum bicolor]
MAPFPRWADQLPDLLCRIGDRLDLKWYASARGACTAWRCALAPPSPTLLVVAADDNSRWCPYAASLPTRRSFELTAVVSGSRCVGSSSNGWLALSVALSSYETVLVLLNPVAAVEILLPPLIYDSRWVSKVVFTPNPTKDDFAAATICENNSIAYVTAGARRWAVVDLDCLTSGDHLVDVVYTDKGSKVYCLTKCGDVYVLRLPERRHRRKPANVVDEEAGGPSSEPAEFSVLRPSYYKELLAPSPDQSQGPHLNPPAIVERLLSEANLPFNPATVFPPSYDIVSSFTSAKNLVLCEGNLYQVWRNQSCTVTLQLPAAAGGHQRRRRVAENEILVLRYYPRRQQPCWDVVKDLGGHSFFVGRNNAVSVYAKGKGVPGLRGNCVYWIGGRGKDEGMVFDMKSGMSTPCGAPPVGFLHGHPHSTICWYFLSDM